MSKAIDNLTEAMKFAGANRPRVGGFPIPGRSSAKSWRNAQHMVAAILPMPLFDSGGSSRHARHPFGQWCRRCTRF